MCNMYVLISASPKGKGLFSIYDVTDIVSQNKNERSRIFFEIRFYYVLSDCLIVRMRVSNYITNI